MLIGSDSEECVLVCRHIYQKTALSVSFHYEIPPKRVCSVQIGHDHHLIVVFIHAN